MRLLDRQYGLRALVLVAFATVGFAASAWAETPLPEIPRGKGDKCVEPTDDMRKNHMNYILHQRDETVISGIRTKRHSLVECIDCHVPKAADPAKQVRADSPKHFCNSCHTYAAVTIDCFQCHADTPSSEPAKTAMADVDNAGNVANIDISRRALDVALGREETQ